jgi:hypothetical protein
MNVNEKLQVVRAQFAQHAELRELLGDIKSICDALPDASRDQDPPWTLPYSQATTIPGGLWSNSRARMLENR